MNVIKNLRTKPKPSDYVRMYHGTTEKAAKNILKKGMRGSSKNPVSSGVYDNSAIFRRKAFVTDNPNIAREYTMQHEYDGKKPDIVALKVLKRNLKKGTNPGEYTAPVKDIKPVTRGVKPIETRRGQVVQEAKVDILRAIGRVPRGKFTPLNIAQAKGAVRNIRGGFYSPSANTLATGLADANKRLKVQSALGNLADPMKNPLAKTNDPQTLYRRVIGSSSKKLSKDSKAIFRDLEKSSKNKNLFGPEISKKDIQFAKNVRSVNKKTSQPTAIKQGAGLTDLQDISRRMKSSNPETADYARKQFTDRKLEVAKRRLIRKGRRMYKPIDDTDKA